MNEECNRQFAEVVKREKKKEKDILDKKNELSAYAVECNKNLGQYDIATKKYDELLQQRGVIPKVWLG